MRLFHLRELDLIWRDQIGGHSFVGLLRASLNCHKRSFLVATAGILSCKELVHGVIVAKCIYGEVDRRVVDEGRRNQGEPAVFRLDKQLVWREGESLLGVHRGQ